MTIPQEWLIDPIAIADVEEGLALEGVSDFWLLQWKSLLHQRIPGDELWEYAGEECVPGDLPFPDSGWDRGWDRYGFALVRGDEVIDWIETRW